MRSGTTWIASANLEAMIDPRSMLWVVLRRAMLGATDAAPLADFR